jgi:hypothetical protein
LGPLFAWRDAAADHASAAGKETADAEKETDVHADEADEEEEAAPSPWSIPLTLVGDLSDLGEEDDGQPAGPGAAEDHRTGEPPAGGEKPAPERTGSDVWARPSWTSAEERRAGPAETDGADRGPWLTRPGKGTTAGRDSGDTAAIRPDDKADADDDATEGKTARWAGALPSRAGRDEAAIRAGGEAGADDHAKATPAGRDANAAAGTPVASSGSVPGSASTPAGAGQRAPGGAKPPSATPAGKATPVGRPSAPLFQPTISAMPGSPPDPVTGKTAGPGSQREAPSAAEGAGGQRAPEAGSGTGAGQTGPAPAGARDDDQRSATKQSGADRSGPAPAPDGNAVVVVPGIARYHRTGCILIRFLGGDDLQTSTAQEAEAKGCAPCRACEPDKPLSSGD